MYKSIEQFIYRKRVSQTHWSPAVFEGQTGGMCTEQLEKVVNPIKNTQSIKNHSSSWT